VLAVAILHASFNASGQITAIHGWWPSYAALAVLAALTAAHRARTRSRARVDPRATATTKALA
jgi:hypothetical protein